jgi:CRP-like cAMP-binding protein
MEVGPEAVTIATLNAGEIFGEEAMLSKTDLATALFTIVADTDCEV